MSRRAASLAHPPKGARPVKKKSGKRAPHRKKNRTFGDSDSVRDARSRLDYVKGQPAIDWLAVLPPELGVEVVHWLDLSALCAAEQVSRHWYRMCNDSSVWPIKYRARWRVQPLSQLEQARMGLLHVPHNWQSLYKLRCRVELDTGLVSRIGVYDDSIPRSSLEWMTWGDKVRVKAEAEDDPATATAMFTIGCEEYAGALAADVREWGAAVGLARCSFELAHLASSTTEAEERLRFAGEVLAAAAAVANGTPAVHFWWGMVHQQLAAVYSNEFRKLEEDLSLDSAIQQFEIAASTRVHIQTPDLDRQTIMFKLGTALGDKVDVMTDGWGLDAGPIPEDVNIPRLQDYINRAVVAFQECLAIDRNYIGGASELGLVTAVKARLARTTAERYATYIDALGLFESEETLINTKVTENGKSVKYGEDQEHADCLGKWARVLMTFAQIGASDLSYERYSTAVDKYRQALAMDDTPLYHYNLARCLCALSELEVANDAAAKDLFDQSVIEYGAACSGAAEDPDTLDTYLHEYAFTLMSYADRTKDARLREILFADAEQKLASLVQRGYVWAMYTLARMYSLRGNSAQCKAYLLNYLSCGEAAWITRAKLSSEARFKFVSGEDWFVAVVSNLPS